MLLKPAHDAPETPQATSKFSVYSENAKPPPPNPLKPATTAPESESQSVLMRVPTVRLDYDAVSSAMAARLATSVLCHVLFLKSQIPFPVVQLSRMPGAQKDARAVKKREELVNAVDTLSSHLQTTFIALSTALAQRHRRVNRKDSGEKERPEGGRAHLAYVLGPSVGAAKARVLFTVDGLELKERTAEALEERRPEAHVSERPEAEETVGESQATYAALGDSDSESEGDSTHTTSESEEDEDSATPPPPSRSPSPSPPPCPSLKVCPDTPPPARKQPVSIKPFRDETCTPLQTSSWPTTENDSPLRCRRTLDSDATRLEKGTVRPSSQALSENISPLSASKTLPAKTVTRLPLGPSPALMSENTPPVTRRALGQRAFGTPLYASPTVFRAQPTTIGQSTNDEQQALRAADRLLSRTLANACAEPDGGLSAELAPTQTHVLLRAPRCFQHPAWVPRQNLTRTLDTQLAAFLEDTVVPASADGEDSLAPTPRRKARPGVRTEGVWVCSRGGLGAAALEGEAEGLSEEDEMIWWAWDGKIVGFSEW